MTEGKQTPAVGANTQSVDQVHKSKNLSSFHEVFFWEIFSWIGNKEFVLQIQEEKYLCSLQIPALFFAMSWIYNNDDELLMLLLPFMGI